MVHVLVVQGDCHSKSLCYCIGLAQLRALAWRECGIFGAHGDPVPGL